MKKWVVKLISPYQNCVQVLLVLTSYANMGGKNDFYMEKGRGRNIRSLFWRIKVDGKRTTVRGEYGVTVISLLKGLRQS